MRPLPFKFNPGTEKKKKMQNETRSALPHLQLFKLRIAHAGPTCRKPRRGQEAAPGAPRP